MQRFEAACQALPLVAILRGLSPPDAQGVGLVVLRAGFRLIEVPLNSPQPFDSIARLCQAFAAPDAGATALKLFPVGGITPHGMAAFVAAGARGFGLGSALFTPGISRMS